MRERLFGDNKIDFKCTICMLILIMVISGVFGFIYETLFYKIDLGYFVKRGSSFGPWIPIYAVGGFLITIFIYRFRKNPLLVFILGCLVTGLLEYCTGFYLYEFRGTRLWDYDTEIWNYGNVNGYICLRSTLFFGLSSLFLIYIVIPLLKKVVFKVEENRLEFFSFLLGFLFLIDVIIYSMVK